MARTKENSPREMTTYARAYVNDHGYRIGEVANDRYEDDGRGNLTLKRSEPVRCIMEVIPDGVVPEFLNDKVTKNLVYRGGYSSCDPIEGVQVPLRVVTVEGGKRKDVTVLRRQTLDPRPLYLQFADLDPLNGSEFIQFANRYGLLGFGDRHVGLHGFEVRHYGLYYHRPPVDEERFIHATRCEPVKAWEVSIEAMRRAVETWKALRDGSLTKTEMAEWKVCFKRDIDGGLKGGLLYESDGPSDDRLIPPLCVRPRDLITCIWYSFRLAIRADRRPRECEQCSRLFTVSSTDARSGKQIYCVNSCRVAGYRAAQKRAAAASPPKPKLKPNAKAGAKSKAKKGVSRG